MDLKNKNILVTGGGGVGIGGGVCQALEKFGATIILNEVSQELANSAAKKYARAIPVVADVQPGDIGKDANHGGDDHHGR